MINRIYHSNLLLKSVLISIIVLSTLINLQSQCTGNIYDPGGASSNYGNNASVINTYTATAGNLMRLTFSSFNTQANNDYLRIYDGPNTSSPLIATLSGNLNSNLPGQITSTGQTITLRFTSNSNTTAAGYAIALSCVVVCSNTTSGGIIASDESACGSFNPANITSTESASGGSGTISYQWQNSTNNLTFADISGATSTTYNPGTISQTTYYRRKSKTSTCTDWGEVSNTITKTVHPAVTASAGDDISQCYNSSFQLIGNAPQSDETSTWSIVSGSPLTYSSVNNDSIIYSLNAGQTATLRYTVTNGTCTSSDNVVITNTTSCSTECVNALNNNGDLEIEGNATNFPLTFQSTPAALLNNANYIPGWADRYASGYTPNTSNFTGAYYIKKTGANGDPYSGSHMVYVNGSPFCLSAMTADAPIACGKTYKFSAWIAAYTNGTTQTSSPFAFEFYASGVSGTPANLVRKLELQAQASNSWNDLNWQRYEFTITIPANNYQWADFYFTPYNNASGIVIDDVCITEVEAGAKAYAGTDHLACSNGITLNATPAESGYSGIWSVVSGAATFSNTSSPTATVTLTSGTTARLRWTVSGGSCSSTDDVVVGYATGTNVSVEDQVICNGWSASLTANNCSNNITWSTGATTPSITVSPSSTTVYSVTCSPTLSSNLVLNGGFESATNFQNWTNSAGSAVTTTSGEYRTGSKGAKISATTAWGGFYQNIAAVAGQMYTVSFWAKMNNTNAKGHVGLKFLNSSSAEVSAVVNTEVTSSTWQKYTITGLAPVNSAFLQILTEAGTPAIMYVDDVEVLRTTSCSSIENATVTVITNDNITLGTPVVSAAIDHPLLDVATVSIQVSWTNPPANDKIKVMHNDKAEYINVGGGATSPQTVSFIVEADGDNNKVISASWTNNPNFACTKYANFSTPSPINNQTIGCNILFLCGLDKPFDGESWDHGMINYINEVNSGTLTTALTKADASGYGLYDWANQSLLLSVNLDNYDLIILSATTEGFVATGLHKALAGWKGNILNMNYDMMQELGYSTNNYVTWNTYGYTSASTQEELLNYDNIDPISGYVLTQGDYYPQAAPSLWGSAGGATNGVGGIFFKYNAHSNPNVSTTHGSRVYLGYHMNGIYANAQNGGALPAPVSSYFSPMKHLTLKGKEILDNALIAAGNCNAEICSNNIDDDGDGLADCYDPDCGQVNNREFESGSTGWTMYQQSGATATLTIDNSSQISGYTSAKINTTIATGTDWHVQFSQGGKSIVAGKMYKFSFKAKAASNRTISSAVDLGVSPYTSYTWNNASLTTSVQSFTYYFTPTVTVNNTIRTVFNLGTTAGNVYIDDVRLEEVCSVFVCADGDCESSNVVVNGSFNSNMNNWTAPNGQLSIGGGGTYGNFVVLNNPDYNSDYYVYQDVNIGENRPYKMTGYFARHGTGTNAKMYLEFYNGTTLLSKSNDVFTTFIFNGNFQAIPPIEGTTPPNTTKIRIVGYARGTALKFDEIALTTCNTLVTTITGNSIICAGSTTTLSPTTGGTWVSSNTAVATVTNAGVVTGIAAGSATFTFTNTAGCTALPTNAVTINSKPTATITGSSTICVGSTTTLSPTTGGTWVSSNTAVATVTNAGVVTGIAAGSATFTFTNSTTGCVSNASSSVTVNAKPAVSITGTTSVCVGGTTTLSPTSGGSWVSSNPTVATVTNAGIVTAVSAGTATFTFTSSSSGCVSNPTGVVTIIAKPVATITGSSSICIGTTTTLSPSTGGTWLSSNTAIATVTNTGIVTGIAAGTATFTFTNSTTGCVSNPTNTVTVNAKPTVTISGPTTICTNATTTLTPSTGGTWLSSNTAIATVTNTGIVTGIAAGTATFTFTNTTTGCVSNPTGAVTVNAKPVATITGQTSICETATTTLSPTTGGTWTSSNTSVATVTNAGVVTGITSGSATFTFTSSTTGCASDPTAAITINTKPVATITGTNVICVGTTTTMSPSTGGTWTSSNNSIATISNSGVVTGVTAGTATFTFTNASTGCISNASASVTVNPKPTVNITGSSTICQTATTTLSPTSGGTWTSSNIAVATVTNAGIVTGIGAGTVTFTFTSAATGCTSNPTSVVTINAKPVPVFTGPSTICLGGSTSLTPSSGGTWSSSNSLVASINNSGIVSAVLLPGTATFTFTNTSTGCVSNASTPVTVTALTSVSITGPSNICVGGTTTLSPSTGGNWTSSNTAVATVTDAGIVTGVGPGTANFTFSNSTTNCISNATSNITVYAKPTVGITGPSNICVGGTTTLSPTSGGTWTSSNNSIATVSNTGVVTGVGQGSVTFTFTNNSTGCTSNATAPITIGASIQVAMDYMGSVCLKENNSQISVNHTNGTSPFTYAWTGPSSFTANSKTINISNNGNYYITVTDAVGCSATTSGFVYQRYEPYIVSLNSEVCEGQSVNISVNSNSAVSYAWSANAGNATSASVSVFPLHPSSTYTVTVTNDLGCTAVPVVTITAKQKPITNITGTSILCVGNTTTLTPGSGGTWSSSNTGVATITNGGVVTAVGAGTATFTFTNSTTQCTSNPSAPVTVYAKPSVLITGPASICKGSNTTLWPTSGGTWTSSNSNIATVSNSGEVLGVNAGVVTFTFTNSTTGCISNPTSTITIDDNEGVTITGPHNSCMGSAINLSVNNPNGTWESSNTSVATISNSGVVTPVSAGSTIITYLLNSGACNNESTHSIVINEKPVATINGSQTICAGNTTTLAPSTGGTWSSSNTAIATVNNNGVVTGLSAGNVTFTFTNSASGCASNPSSPITVNAKPDAIVTGPAAICSGSTTTLSPSTGGTWSSSNSSVATVTNNGLVTGVTNGTATFTFTNTVTGCVSNPSSSVIIGASFTATLDYNGSTCLTDTSKIKAITSGGLPPFLYNWIGPSGFTGNTQTVNITSNGNYYLTVTDANGCSDSRSGYVYERYEPIILNLNSTVCEGTFVNLSVNASNAVSYQWSPNAGSLSTSSVSVTPSVPSSAYFVTVTNNLGCHAIANALINVNQKPIASIIGEDSICINNTTFLVPSSEGSWSSSNNSIATISNDGMVTGISSGTATFIYTNSITNCSSDETTPVTVSGNTNVAAKGPTSICIGDTTYLSPSSGGIWHSSNPGVAQINNSGRVIALASGISNFTFTNTNTGCTTNNNTINIIVNNKPMTALTGDAEICLGSTTTFVPNNGGTWISNDPSIATINNNGIVTALGIGNVSFVFEESGSGCRSDNTTLINIVNGTSVSITGPNPICIGSTTSLSPSTGGTWSSSNPAIASVSNNGIVTGINSGLVYFTYHNLSTGCNSVTEDSIEILPRPIVNINGPSSICIGSTTNLSPSSGGTWSSNNPSIATINNNGMITGVALGNATFVFTNSLTGCISHNSSVITVYNKPAAVITGPTDVCIGGTTTVTPTNGGSWTSSNPAIATITNSGVVTGISLGTVNFTYFETNSSCISDPTSNINIISKPNVSITGSSTICIGNTTTLSPSTGGAWISSNNAVATVSSNGVVTGVKQGTVTFTFIANGGCTSNPTLPITVNGKPSVSINGPSAICVGNTTQMNPSTGGTWISLNPAIAAINNAGLVTGLAQGVARFKFTSNATGCISEATNEVVVNPSPTVSLIGSASICIGQNTQVSPTTGGIWVSNNPNIASVNNAGYITGIASGTTSFTFTSTTTGCSSINPITISVNPKPNVIILGASEICANSTTTLYPSSGGTWTCNNLSVATVSNNGVVTGLSQGTAKFLFTDNNTGCQSNYTGNVIVNPKPTILFTGPNEICIGSTTTITPVSGGTWQSSNDNIATISNNGIITGIDDGTVSFTFTSAITHCISNPSDDLTVNDEINVQVTGPTEICMGYSTTLSPSTGGFWTSLNPDIANISAAGVVLAKAPGKVGFYFTQSVTGCVSFLEDDAITIENCINPDFNVAMVNDQILGDVSTNDLIGLPSSYNNNYILLSKPSASIAHLNVNEDGTYSFSANTIGQYKYKVQVCIDPLNYGCPTSQLVITVVDPFSDQVDIVANTDISEVYVSTQSNVKQTSIINMYNDDCIATSNCDLSASNISINHPPIRGGYTINANNVVYTPQNNYIGRDTIQTMVCEDNSNSNCAYSDQFLVIRHNTANNTIVAADDFFNTNSGTALNGNVKLNDKDPEGNTITVIQQGDLNNPVVITQGSYYLLNDGTFHFDPIQGFSGSFDIVYQICDDNVNQACRNATIHVLVFGDMFIQVKVYLEGALMSNGNQVSSTGSPLMRDNLRNNPFDGKNHIPIKDPYKFGTPFVDVVGSYQHVACGSLPKFDQVLDSSAIFSVEGDDAVVDWVFVELRSKNDPSHVFATRSGLVQRDGDVIDIDGNNKLFFPGLMVDSFYVAIRHRSHLGAMSKIVNKDRLIDFTTPDLEVFDFGTSLYSSFDYSELAMNTTVEFGYRALWAGDSNADGKIKFTNPGDDQNLLFFDVFSHAANTNGNANFDMTIGYFQGDFNMNGKAKFDNPNDDKNLLFGQILLYPLNQGYLSNFNFFIQQIP